MSSDNQTLYTHLNFSSNAYNSDLNTCLAAFTPTVLHSRYYEQLIGGGAFLIYSDVLNLTKMSLQNWLSIEVPLKK